jgi:DNA repair protein RadC
MAVVTARHAADLLAPLFTDAREEKLALLYLDAGRHLLALDERPGAGTDAVDLHMREIFRAALNHGAVGLIIAHNHPSGNPEPSRADIEATRTLAQTAASLGIVLHDHLIFAGDDCRSFRALGLL